MRLSTIEICITKWDKYYKCRSDIKRAHWFRLQNDWWNGPKFFGVSSDIKMVWIALLSIASKKMCAKVEVNTAYIANTLQLKKTEVEKACNLFAKMEMISITSQNLCTPRTENVPYITEHNNTEHNNVSTEVLTTTEQKQVSDSAVIPELLNNFDSDELLKKVSERSQKRWLKLYDAPYIKRELVKMCNWLEINPQKARKTPRGFSQFISTWLDRSWDQHLRGLPSASQGVRNNQANKPFGEQIYDGNMDTLRQLREIKSGSRKELASESSGVVDSSLHLPPGVDKT